MNELFVLLHVRDKNRKAKQVSEQVTLGLGDMTVLQLCVRSFLADTIPSFLLIYKGDIPRPPGEARNCRYSTPYMYCVFYFIHILCVKFNL